MTLISTSGNLARAPRLHTDERGTVAYATVIATDRVQNKNDEWVDGPKTFYELTLKGADAKALLALHKTFGNFRFAFSGYLRSTWWESDNGPKPENRITVTDAGFALRDLARTLDLPDPTKETPDAHVTNDADAPTEAPAEPAPIYGDAPSNDDYQGGPVDQW